MPYCTNCGNENISGATFCTSCGSRLKESKKVSKSDQTSTTNGIVTKTNGPLLINNYQVKNILLYYFLLNIPLYILSSGIDEIIGVQIFSLIILITFFLRAKKEKVVNWFMKIIFVLQSILIFSIFMTQSEYLFSNLFSVLLTLSLLALFCITIVLLFKRDKIQ